MYLTPPMAVRLDAWHVTDIRALAELLAPDVSLRKRLPRCFLVSNATALGSGLRPEHLAILNIVVPNDGRYLQVLRCPCTYRFPISQSPERC